MPLENEQSGTAEGGGFFDSVEKQRLFSESTRRPHLFEQILQFAVHEFSTVKGHITKTRIPEIMTAKLDVRCVQMCA